MRAFFHRNGLSIVTLLLLLLFWAAQAAVGFQAHNDDLEEHGRQALGLGAVLALADAGGPRRAVLRGPLSHVSAARPSPRKWRHRTAEQVGRLPGLIAP